MSKTSLSITRQATLGLSFLSILLWLVLFLPSWTLDYWQAWVFGITFVVCISVVSLFFIKKDLTLIASRLKVGSSEEMRGQKATQAIIGISFVLLLLIPSLDHRFNWSSVPFYVSIVAEFFIVLGLTIIFLVFRENSYTSVLIEVKEEQRVISNGLYSRVRHPMYSGALLMLCFIPLALGSYWGLLIFLPILVAIPIRIKGEEEFLTKNLQGYDEYCKKVRFRLIPFLW
jgi:protein-S-isoprenylcysteine O-methyltransferase Ste14